MNSSGTTPKNSATSKWRETSEILDSGASSSEEDEQQAKNYQLFVAIRKKNLEKTIIQEINDLLNSGADINAFNNRHKTIVDLARNKKYESLEKYLIGRGGKTAFDIDHDIEDIHQKIEVNCTNNDSDILEMLNAESELQDERQMLIRFRIDDKREELDALLKKGTNNLTQDKLEEINAKLKSEFQIQEVIEALIRCEIDLNYQDSRSSECAIDIAWDNEYYDAMLMLLEADSKFPLHFYDYLDTFYENPNIPKKLKDFVRERQALHEWIRNDKLENVQKFIAVNKLSNCFNCENKSALEIAAEFANVDTLASVIGIILPSNEITISEEQIKLLQQLNPEGNTLLSVAAKCGNGDNVDFLLRCGIQINHSNINNDSAVDLAWRNEHYDVVHILLKADSNFPNAFNLDALNVANAEDLRQFVEGRNKLHELIKENRLIEIREFVAHDTSTLYLNSEGKSALFTALVSRRYEIYAFLQSIGLNLTPHEEEYINELSSEEKYALKTELMRKFPQIDNGHILFLMSKSRSKKPVENFNKIIENLYIYLDDIPEISILMQVLQYIEYLDLVFDFDKKHIIDINPSSPKCCKGIAEYICGRIYIGAGTDEKTVAGTLAHELAHLAMYFLYENYCNPFDDDGESRHEFEKITDTIREKLKETKDQMSGYKESPEKTLAEILLYPDNEHPSELIVRVPQILAEYSTEGRNLLTSRKEFKLLFDYYNNQEEGGLMHRCKKNIENSFFIKPSKCIQIFNKSVGKIDEIIKYGIHFELCIDLDNFLRNETQVFLLETGSTFLSSLNIYDSLIMRNKNFLKDSFLLEFNSYIENEDIILYLLQSPASKVLCISYSCDSSKEQLLNALNNIKELLKQRPDKKVIFIIQESETEILSKLISTFNDNCEKSVQHKFTLNDFTVESQLKILEREILFHEENINLNNFINILDDKAKAVIDANILVKLIKGESIEIGRRPPDTSHLEGAYSELFQEIDIDTFVDKLLEQNSKEVYIISGISGSNKQDMLVNCLRNKTEDINRIPKVNALKSHIEVLDVQGVNRNISKSMQVTGDQFKPKHFKQMCHNNSAMKIYWIHWRNEIGNSQFILQRIYNPDFYVTGKRISNEVVIEKCVVRELTSSELSETFIISMNENSDIQKWLQLNSKQEKQLKHNVQSKKINFVYLQDDAEDYFPESVEANQTVHLLKFKDDHLIWYKTFGSLNTLPEYRAKEYKSIEPLIEENDAIKMIKDNKVSIIAGDPGTGKSTIITRLYNGSYSSKSGQEETLMHSHWVIKVNLKDHVATIKNMALHCNELSEITEFLLQADKNLSHDTSQTLAQGLIDMSLQKKNFVKPLLIIFDSFDEVLDKTNRNNIIKLLKYLKEKTNAKFCITTRLHYVQDLERALSTFAMKLVPMDGPTIHTFIAKSLSNRLSLRLNQDKFTQFFDNDGERMLRYSDAFISKMQEVFSHDGGEFIGTPLQLYLMLENSVVSFLEWMNDSSKYPDFSYLGNDIWEVYENFVGKKYDYFSKTKTRLKEEILYLNNRKYLDKHHMDLAKSIIFKSELKESLKDIPEIIISAGIVRSEGNLLSFMHPTFAEYFAAKAVVYWIRKWKKGGFINFAKQKYFFTKILQVLDYEVVRTFLNAKLLKEKDNTVELKSAYYHKHIVLRAAAENHVGIAKFVLDNFPNVDVNEDNNDDSVLRKAVKEGHLEIVKYLIEKGANFNDHNWMRQTTLAIAAKLGHLEITKLLIDKGANVNAIDKWHRTALHLACRFGHLEIVKLLIDKVENVNARDQAGRQTALTFAAESGHLEITKLLIDKGADTNVPDKSGQIALHFACRSGHLDIVKLLIDKVKNVNDGDRTRQTALTIAAESGHLEITKFLIDKGVDVNAVDRSGRKALYLACKSGHLEIVELLLDKVDNVNAGDRTCQTALTIAATSGHLEITKLLLDKGVDPNDGDESGQIALQSACRSGHLEIVKFLIGNGAKVDAICRSGETALYSACKLGHLEIVKLLISEIVYIETEEGKTALLAAKENGHSAIVKLLKSHFQQKKRKTALKRGAETDKFENNIYSKKRKY